MAAYKFVTHNFVDVKDEADENEFLEFAQHLKLSGFVVSISNSNNHWFNGEPVKRVKRLSPFSWLFLNICDQYKHNNCKMRLQEKYQFIQNDNLDAT
jgi:hypothetical protein